MRKLTAAIIAAVAETTGQTGPPHQQHLVDHEQTLYNKRVLLVS